MSSSNLPAHGRFHFFVFKVTYCSLTCQKLHWFTHKRMCRSLQEANADLEKDTPRLKELKGDHVLSVLYSYVPYTCGLLSCFFLMED